LQVSCNDEDASIAKSIRQRLGQHKPQIPYCDIASKAADCGKKELAIRLLEHEISVEKQVEIFSLNDTIAFLFFQSYYCFRYLCY